MRVLHTNELGDRTNTHGKNGGSPDVVNIYYTHIVCLPSSASALRRDTQSNMSTLSTNKQNQDKNRTVFDIYIFHLLGGCSYFKQTVNV